MTANRLHLPLFRGFAGFRAAGLPADLLAGVTLAAVAIPEQMATARLAGLAPQAGFVAFVAGALAFSVFGASRRLSVGADSTIAPIFAGGLAALAASAGGAPYPLLAAALAVLVGAVVAGAAVLRMGWIGNLLSAPVTLGFLAGVAVHIALSQAPAAMGVAAPHGEALARIAALAAAVPRANAYTVAIAAGVLALIALSHRLSARMPGPLITVAATSVAVAALHLTSRGVTLLGVVAVSPPHIAFPSLVALDWLRLAPLAAMIALVVMVQTATTSRAFPAQGEIADVDGDILGAGVASLVAGLAGAFPVNASPPRTAIAAEGGARSPAAGLAAAALICVVLGFGAGLLRLIPTAALSGVLLFVALRLVRVKQMAAVVRASPAEALLIAATASAIVVLPIQDGVAVGVVLSLLHGVWSGARTRVLVFVRVPGTTVWWPRTPAQPGERVEGVLVAGYPSALTFLNAETFARELEAAARAESPPPRLIILEGAGIADIDFTASKALAKVVEDWRAGGRDFALARLESPRAQASLTRLGLRALIGDDHIFDSVAEAVAASPAAGQRR